MGAMQERRPAPGPLLSQPRQPTGTRVQAGGGCARLCAALRRKPHLRAGGGVVGVHEVHAAVVHQAQQRGGVPAGGARKGSVGVQRCGSLSQRPGGNTMLPKPARNPSTPHFWIRSFQPMCGTGSPLLVSKWVTAPGMRPMPSQPPFSSEPSKSSCMPRQMPKKGRSDWM